jgi:tRNA A37 methylthiotransferase MiaB
LPKPVLQGSFAEAVFDRRERKRERGREVGMDAAAAAAAQMERHSSAAAQMERHSSAAAFVEGGVQDGCDDTCSICLETFSDSDPSAVRAPVMR